MRINRLALILLLAYMALLAVLTLRPVGADADTALRLNLRPWATIGPALRLGPGSFPFRILVGNLLAFVPLGILLPATSRRIPWPAVILTGLTLSVAIELAQLALSLQLGFGYRSADVDDVIVNVCGSVVGLGLFGAALLVGGVAKRVRSAG